MCMWQGVIKAAERNISSILTHHRPVSISMNSFGKWQFKFVLFNGNIFT